MGPKKRRRSKYIDKNGRLKPARGSDAKDAHWELHDDNVWRLKDALLAVRKGIDRLLLGEPLDPSGQRFVGEFMDAYDKWQSLYDEVDRKKRLIMVVQGLEWAHDKEISSVEFANRVNVMINSIRESLGVELSEAQKDTLRTPPPPMYFGSNSARHIALEKIYEVLGYSGSIFYKDLDQWRNDSQVFLSEWLKSCPGN